MHLVCTLLNLILLLIQDKTHKYHTNGKVEKTTPNTVGFEADLSLPQAEVSMRLMG